MMKDLNEVVVFAHVASELSFTRAAAVLGLPKSSVSDRIARLEARLGVRLLERTTRLLRLTPAGEAYYARVSRLMSELDDADAEIADSQQAPRGVLRVASPLTFAQLFLDEVIHEYLGLYPDVSVDLIAEDRAFKVIEEGLDLAVHVAGPLGAQLVARRLGVVEAWCVAAPSYLEAHGTPSEPSELSSHTCISGGFLRDPRWTFHRGDATVVVDVALRYMVTSIELAHRAVLRGDGIAISPGALSANDVTAGRLVRLFEDWSTSERVVSLVYPSRQHQAVRTRAFIDLVVERFNALKKRANSAGRDGVHSLVR